MVIQGKSIYIVGLFSRSKPEYIGFVDDKREMRVLRKSRPEMQQWAWHCKTTPIYAINGRGLEKNLPKGRAFAQTKQLNCILLKPKEKFTSKLHLTKP